MKKEFIKILEALNFETETLEANVSDILLRSEQGTKISSLAIENARNLVLTKGFENELSEIRFFKNTKL